MMTQREETQVTLHWDKALSRGCIKVVCECALGERKKTARLRSGPHYYQSSKLGAFTYGTNLEYRTGRKGRQNEATLLSRADA